MKKYLIFLSENFHFFDGKIINIQSTLVISNSKGLFEILRDIRT